MGPMDTSKAADTRDAILDAAGVLLGRYGYQKTTMDDLAREAGIARRTLYLHFRCKDDIFLARIDRVVERLLAEERRVAQGNAPPVEKLTALLRLRVLFRLDTVKDYHQSLDEIFASLRGPYLERRASWFLSEEAIVARVLEEGRDEGAFAYDDARATAHALVAATNSLIPYALSPRELGSRRDVEATLARVTELLVRGLRPRGAGV